MQAQTGQSSDLSISQYSGTWGSHAANSALLEPGRDPEQNISCVPEDAQAVEWQKFGSFTFLTIEYEVGKKTVCSYNNLRKVSCLRHVTSAEFNIYIHSERKTYSKKNRRDRPSAGGLPHECSLGKGQNHGKSLLRTRILVTQWDTAPGLSFTDSKQNRLLNYGLQDKW